MDRNISHSWSDTAEAAASIAVLAGITAAMVLYWLNRMDTLAVKLLFGKLAALAAGAGLTFLAVRCMTAPLRARKLPHRGEGRVEGISKDTGFDSSFAMGRSVVPGAGFMEQGKGGSWTWFFMLWNEIRPDHWYPVVSYTDEEGKQRRAVFRYGGLKNTWRPGDTVEIGWDDRAEGVVYPLEGRWMRIKGLCLCLPAALLLLAGIRRLPALMRVCQTEDAKWRYTVDEVYDGYPRQYVGSVDVTDGGIVLNFMKCDGEQEAIPIDCGMGDRLVLTVEDLSADGGNSLSVMLRTARMVGEHSYDSLEPFYEERETLDDGRVTRGMLTMSKRRGEDPALVIRGRAGAGRITLAVERQDPSEYGQSE